MSQLTHRAEIREENVLIPTYGCGKPDRNPMFLEKRVYQGSSGKVYPLGSGKALPLKVYIQQLRDAIDPALSLDFGRIPYGPLQVMHLQADISELAEDTGFVPSTAFDEGIRQTIEHLKRN